MSITLFETLTSAESPQFHIRFLSDQDDLFEAISKEPQAPSLILFEQYSSDPDLFRSLRLLKRHPLSKDIRLIILIENIQLQQAEIAVQLGAFSILEKPVNAEFMKTLIELVNILTM
ncbi:MAG: hypothetical protein AAF696_30400 [Bacteroidota bacterium]